MKKLFLLASGFVATLSLLGANYFLSVTQTVPVTVAQSSPVQAAAYVEPGVQARSTDVVVTATAQSLSTLPTLPPIVTRTPFPTQTGEAFFAVETVAREPTKTTDEINLDRFVQAVANQEAGQVTGVYVSDRFALPVLQQPLGDASFVSSQDNSVTQFRSASAYGTVGLLAHNYLSGIKFFDLREGDTVTIVYGDSRQATYQITSIERYQALSPTSVYSDFIDLSDPTQEILSAGKVFNRVYTGENQVVFQTCIEANGDPSWGRIFVIAERLSP